MVAEGGEKSELTKKMCQVYKTLATCKLTTVSEDVYGLEISSLFKVGFFRLVFFIK